MKKTITQLVNENLFGGNGSLENVDLFAKRIIRGVFRLDQHLDGWYNKINLVSFDVMNLLQCVCGQLCISSDDLLLWINEENRQEFCWEDYPDIPNNLKLHEEFGFFIQFNDRYDMDMKNPTDGLNYIWTAIIVNLKQCTDLISFE